MVENLNSVQDPELRKKPTPDYRPMYKRLVMSWNYYDAIEADNAHLETGAIEGFEEGGIRMENGTFHELDLVVLATGFEVNQFIRPTVVTGRDNLQLDEVWSQRPVAYRSISIPGFPNLFFLNGPNSPVGNLSLIDVAEKQWDYIAQLLDRIDSGEYTHIEATEKALCEFETARTEAAKHTIFASGCSSWYLDAEGVPAGWPWSYNEFTKTMQAPAHEDFDFR